MNDQQDCPRSPGGCLRGCLHGYCSLEAEQERRKKERARPGTHDETMLDRFLRPVGLTATQLEGAKSAARAYALHVLRRHGKE